MSPDAPRPAGEGREPPPEYRVYRTRPKFLGDRDGTPATRPAPAGPPARRGRRGVRPRPGARRILVWLLRALAFWIVLSGVLFLFSAQFLQDRVDQATRDQLGSGGVPVFGASTILVLGSDRRAPGSAEPGARSSGPSRSDSIQLLRVGGGHSAKLSIPRDMAVPIPGHGVDKINAAFAYGGSALAVQTIKDFLGIRIDHVVLVNFERFPKLVDAMGGVTYTGGCVVSRINGGFRNGGYTLRLRAGSTHVDGRQALALARTRHNDCNRSESDLTRARRQQKLTSAMKSRAFSPGGFIRWPLIALQAPQTLSTDMGAAGLSGLVATLATTGNGSPRILRPTGATTLSNGGAALTITDASKQRQVARFLAR